jgi:hypothetical protein
MGDALAAAADRIYRESVQSPEVWKLTQAAGVPVPVDVLELIGVQARAMRLALLFLAQRMDDPEDADIGEALLESLRAIIATEPAG